MKGYVVVDNDHMLELDDARANGHPYNRTLLLWGDYGTIFPTYDNARNAIARTARYAARRNYDWQCETWRIRQVRSI